MDAIIEKVTSKTVVTKYNSLLDAIDGKYQTNMSTKKITSLIKYQLNDMKPWTVTSTSLTGTDAKDYTYTYNQLLYVNLHPYVMKPDQQNLEETISLIERVISGEKLENSYSNKGETSNKVTQVKPNKKDESKKENNSISTQKKEETLKEEDNKNDDNVLEDYDDSKKQDDTTNNNNDSEDNINKDQSQDLNSDINNKIETNNPIEDLLPEIPNE